MAAPVHVEQPHVVPPPTPEPDSEIATTPLDPDIAVVASAPQAWYPGAPAQGASAPTEPAPWADLATPQAASAPVMGGGAPVIAPAHLVEHLAVETMQPVPVPHAAPSAPTGAREPVVMRQPESSGGASRFTAGAILLVAGAAGIIAGKLLLGMT
jgi:hypothetical protein